MNAYRSDKRYVLFHIGLLACVALVTFYFTVRITPEEEQRYRELMVVETPKGYRTQQERQGIYRQILLVHDHTRLQTRLTAQEGVFFVHQEEANPGITEELKDITVLMQEELLADGSQIFRYIQAHEATYDYRTNFLKTEEMTFARYESPSHQLPQTVSGLKPMMTGKAMTAAIVFKDSGPEFHAEKLQVNLPDVRIK